MAKGCNALANGSAGGASRSSCGTRTTNYLSALSVDLKTTPAFITNPTARSALICVRSVRRSSVMAHAVASPHVSREVERGCAKKRTIITFSIDNAPLSLALELFLSESHWLDAVGRRKRYLTPDERRVHRTGQAVLLSG